MELGSTEIITNKCSISDVVFNSIEIPSIDTDSPITIQDFKSDTNIIDTLTCPSATVGQLISSNLSVSDTLQGTTLDSNTITVSNLQASTLDSTNFDSSQASCNTLTTVNFSCNVVNSKYYETNQFTTLNAEIIQDTSTATVPTRVASTFYNGVLSTGVEYKVINNTPSLFSDLQLATDSTGTNTLYIYGDVLSLTESLPRIIGYNSVIGGYDNSTAFGGKTAYLSLCSDSSGAPKTLRYERDGKLTVYSNVNTIFWQSTNMVSDIRDKVDIRPIATSCLEKLDNLQGYYYNYRGGDGRQEIGLLAQDVVKDFPEAVLIPEGVEDPYMSLDYAKLVPVLIESLKEVADQLESLSSSK